MNYKQISDFWGGPARVAKALGVNSRQTVHMWSYYPRVPSRWQLVAQARSGGKLRADRQAHREAMEIVTAVAQSAGT